MSKELQKFRKKIDEIDDQIIKMLSERIKIVEEIAKIKEKYRLSTVDKPREIEVLEKNESLAEKTGLGGAFIRELWKKIMEYSTSREDLLRGKRSRVAFLGPRGTFTEEAAHKFSLNISSEFIPINTIEGIIRGIEKGRFDYGVIPIENSVEGSVTATLDLLAEAGENAKICAEVILPVIHFLVAKEKIEFEEIAEVYSHPHALAQCRSFITKNLPHTKLVDTYSTADAAKKVAMNEEINIAAICSKYAGQLYNLTILAENIQDLKINATRFAILANQDEETIKPSEIYKTSIVLYLLENRPGALHDVLKEFATRQIDLTRIESRPTKKTMGDYLFYFDIIGHRKETIVKEALEGVKKYVGELKILGSFKRVS
ncbi:MAG: prephenate dehydratase [Candidatus Wukongarchaeota archaeon]|nr:prephenate dehydratase [Candidatus Wukongarchaeota archaeon]